MKAQVLAIIIIWFLWMSLYFIFIGGYINTISNDMLANHPEYDGLTYFMFKYMAIWVFILSIVGLVAVMYGLGGA